MTDRSRNDRFGILVAVLGGLLVALAAVLIILLVDRNGSGTTTTAAASTTATTAAQTTTEAVTTSAVTTTAVTTTTEVTTTTQAASTTTAAPTTTIPFFAGDFETKTGPTQGSPTGRLVGIRAADHPGYARLVLDFSPGGTPSYWIGYTDATTLTVILYPMNDGDPYDAGIFDAGGVYPVGLGNIVSVRDSGMGGGSMEWVFDIVVTAQRPFLAGALADPPRIYVDLGD